MLQLVGIMGASDEGLNDPWPLGDEPTIDGFHSLYDYHENTEELKCKFFYTTLELESLRTSTKEEMKRKEEELRRKEESISQLTHERDEARDQLQMLLNKIAAVPLQHDSPTIRPTRGGSSITESDSLSDTLNNHKSFVSSPVESFFDNVTSPDMNIPGSITAAQNQHILPQCKSSPGIAEGDQGSMIIDYIAMRRGLPEKRKLLETVQAVTRATPLLETLLTTGPLPQWRNPPPLQLFPIPPVVVDRRGVHSAAAAAAVSPSVYVQRALLNGLHHEKSQGGSHASMGTIASPRLISCQRSSSKRKMSQ